MLRPRLRTPFAALVALAVLAGCGRKAPLEAPPPPGLDPAVAAGSEAPPRHDRRFVLDPLIQSNP